MVRIQNISFWSAAMLIPHYFFENSLHALHVWVPVSIWTMDVYKYSSGYRTGHGC